MRYQTPPPPPEVKEIDIVEKDYFKERKPPQKIDKFVLLSIPQQEEMIKSGFNFWDLFLIFKKIPILFKLIIYIIKLRGLLMSDQKTTNNGRNKMIGIIVFIIVQGLKLLGLEIPADFEASLYAVAAAVYGFFSFNQAKNSADAAE